MNEQCPTTEAELLHDQYREDYNDYFDTQPQKFKGLSVWHAADLDLLINYSDANIIEASHIKLLNFVHDLKYARIDTHRAEAVERLQIALDLLPIGVVQQHLDDVQFDKDIEFLYKTYGISTSQNIGTYEDRP